VNRSDSNNGSKNRRALAVALLAAAIVAVAVFFVMRAERRRAAELLKKNSVLAVQGHHKIFSSQYIVKNAPPAEQLSAKDSAALIAYQAAYAADSEQRAIARKSVQAAESARAAEAVAGETVARAEKVPPYDCSKDTLAPLVVPDSTGGVHIGPAHVFLQTNKPCSVFWRFEPDTAWHEWSADTFVIDCTVTLAFKATDRCGRSTIPGLVRYEIKPFGFVEGAPELPSVNCASDTVMPWVYPDPAGGLHYGPTHVCFQPNKPCTILWRSGRDTAWQVWHAETLLIDSSTVIAYKAVDRCGHTMDPMEAYYEIRSPRKTFPCGAGMEPVETNALQFCIDRYEWPNRKGAVPQSYISIYAAMDSCAAVGKRLCTSDEWTLACAGPDSFSYPYGRTYAKNACVTQDTTMRRSGSKPECRGFFGAYDMSGNLAEWTSTPAKRNARFYNVMGGFWESGPASGCFSTRYSYYPQNRHNPVGFRCCKDFAAAGK
jgi:hypothetical protein